MPQSHKHSTEQSPAEPQVSPKKEQPENPPSAEQDESLQPAIFLVVLLFLIGLLLLNWFVGHSTNENDLLSVLWVFSGVMFLSIHRNREDNTDRRFLIFGILALAVALFYLVRHVLFIVG